MGVVARRGMVAMGFGFEESREITRERERERERELELFNKK